MSTFLFFRSFLIIFPQPALPASIASNPTGANDEIDSSIHSGVGDSNHDLGGVCAPNHHLDGSGETGPVALNQDSFQPTPLELELGESNTGIYIPALQVTMENIRALKNAVLEEGKMSPEDVNRLRDPDLECCTLDMSDRHLVKALRHFIYSTGSSRDHYETIWKVDMATYPGDKFLSFD